MKNNVNSPFDISTNSPANDNSLLENIRVRSVSGQPTTNHYAGWADEQTIIKNTRGEYSLMKVMHSILIGLSVGLSQGLNQPKWDEETETWVES